MRILTFNHHEPFLCSLSEVGHQFDVVIRYKKLDLSWNKSNRKVPDNFHLVEFDDDLKEKLRSGYYDLVICHTLKNLLWLFPYFKISFVFIAHIPLFWYTPALIFKSLSKKLVYKIFQLTHKVRFVAVSEFKRRMWAERGDVVVLSPQKFPEVTVDASTEQPIVVCNQLAQRGRELGFDLIRELQKTISVLIIGDNPGVAGAFKPKNFSEFVSVFCRHRVYLYTVRYPYGDGYNTAMLEAMSMGMAVVSVPNPSSPIKHEINGLIATDLDDLKACLQRLARDPLLAQRLGEQAKKTVCENFSQRGFIDGWRQILYPFENSSRTCMIGKTE